MPVSDKAPEELSTVPLDVISLHDAVGILVPLSERISPLHVARVPELISVGVSREPVDAILPASEMIEVSQDVSV